MKTFLLLQNRLFLGAIFIIWALGLFFAKFAVVWNVTQTEIFKIPQTVINVLILFWFLQKTIKTYKNNSAFFVVLVLFWLVALLNIIQFLLNNL